MKVYKFGGASVRNADGVRNLRRIIDDEQHLFIIVSAMGKTTNALEKVFEGLQKGDRQQSLDHIAQLRQYHAEIIDDLWHEHRQLERVERLFDELEHVATQTRYLPEEAELWYDTIVAYGELVSTTIISEYLNYAGVPNRWIDMRRCFVTEQRHKDAGVDLAASTPLLREAVGGGPETIFIGQGFIGGAPDGTTTTLGREGSDYSAAVAANILDAESMSVWKDVDGVLNADPKIFPDAVQIAELNYLDTIELAYSGAQIIHPKTIKPLQNKNIPLYVRPFGDKRKPGTVIRGMSAPVDVPILILKKDQVLLTIRSRDFSFVLEEKFATIFSLLEHFRIKTNLIHNSAVNLSLCVDNSWHIDEVVRALRESGFDVMTTRDMELLTIRGYTDDLWRRYARGPQVFIRQATQSTVRVVRKKQGQY
ncbi:aspartate kinase [Alistipes sp. An54]|uniref:aspartate kinase n=1 Tax=Alistipes sp. An54 TaxID=1965645 RepID=UPI000B382939|nr:aspartate kinase [Alistipes sp. An54]OUN76559.1 aspartate kinase [Alistipes sp. An54]